MAQSAATRTPTFRKGDAVIGLGRNGSTWRSRPTGIVTKVYSLSGCMSRTIVRVQWDDCCVEDDMAPAELIAR